MKPKLLSGLLLAIFLFSLASPALAAPSVHGRHLLFGKVTAIQNSTLIVDTWKGEVAVLTDEETRFRIPGVEEPTIEDMEVGDRIIAWGHYDDEDNFTARLVVIVPCRPWRTKVIRGEVKAIGDSTLIVDTWKGEVTVVIDEGTRFRIPGVEEPTIEDIEVGDYIIAWGYYDEEGNFTARSITVLSFDLIHYRFPSWQRDHGPRIKPSPSQARPSPIPRRRPWSSQQERR